MGGAPIQALVFLIQVIFGLYGTVIILRMLLRMVRADYHHPLVQAIVKLTRMPISFFKKFIPDAGSIETASVVLFMLVNLLKLLLLALLGGAMPNIVGLLVWSFGDLIAEVIQVLFFLIIIRAIFSWFNPNPMIAQLLDLVTNPVLRPIQKRLPALGGLDLTPLVAIVLLQLVNILLANPIIAVGMRLSLQ